MSDANEKKWGRVLAVGLSSVVVLGLAVVILTNAASQFFEKRNPSLAITLNPLNDVARIAQLDRGMREAAEKGGADRLENPTRALVALAPKNSNGFVLLGQIRRLNGDLEGADVMMDHALNLSDTNLVALQWNLFRAVQMGQSIKAAETLNLLMLRWPGRWETTLPAVVQLAQQADGLDAIAKTFQDDTRQRTNLLNGLRIDAANPVLTSRLLLRMHQNGAPNLASEITRTISELMRADEISAAQNLFLFTLNAQERQHLGYVFNSTFKPLSVQGQFNWALNSKPGVSIGYSKSDQGGLDIAFLDAPTRVTTAVQTLVLHGGTYRLKVRSSARDLDLSDPLSIVVHCVGAPAVPMATVEVPDGDYANAEATVDFNVSSDGCEAQKIQLTNGVQTLDWKSVNSGTLTIHEVAITQVEEPS